MDILELGIGFVQADQVVGISSCHWSEDGNLSYYVYTINHSILIKTYAGLNTEQKIKAQKEYYRVRDIILLLVLERGTKKGEESKVIKSINDTKN